MAPTRSALPEPLLNRRCLDGINECYSEDGHEGVPGAKLFDDARCEVGLKGHCKEFAFAPAAPETVRMGRASGSEGV
jgi:hypothetical protein